MARASDVKAITYCCRPRRLKIASSGRPSTKLVCELATGTSRVSGGILILTTGRLGIQMAYIKLMFAEVQQLSTELSTKGQNMLSELSALAAKADPAGVFEGDAARAYFNAFSRWKKAQDDASHALTELSRALKVVSDNFAQVNQQGAAGFTKFYGG
jgi:WXG100 family type VII secretion target